MSRTKKLLLLGALPVVGFVGLWIAGPEPLRSAPYVQAVTNSSATIAQVFAAPTSVRVTVQSQSPHGAPAPIVATSRQPARFQAVQVSGLEAQRRYRYLVEPLDAEGRSAGGEAGEFRTAPDRDTATFEFVAVGDSGALPWWHHAFNKLGWLRARSLFVPMGLPQNWEVAKWIERQDIDFVLHLGDVVYPDGQVDGYQEAFFRPLEAVLRKVCMFAVIGNHDTHTEAGKPFFDVFHLPVNDVDGGEHSYTIAWGPVTIVVMDIQRQDWTPESPMGRWLERTLAAATSPWLLVSMHQPVFDASVHGDNEYLQAHVFPVLARHRVDLLLAGHSHNYQRFEPVQGVVQLVAGGGGKSIYEIREDSRLAASAESYGFLKIAVRGRTLQGEAWDQRGQLLDRFEIVRSAGDGGLPAGSPRLPRMLALP